MSDTKASVYVRQELAERLRSIAEREGRAIVDVVARMADLYEPLTLVDHAVLGQLAREHNLEKPGHAISFVLQKYRTVGRS